MELKNDIQNNMNETTKGERFKKYKYKDERKALTKKLLQYLHIDANNKIFDNIHINEQTQKDILDLIPKIEQYFSVAKWYYYQKNKNIKDKPYVSLAKSLLKDMGIKILSASKKEKLDDIAVSCTVYVITSNIDEFLI